jgi:hypothetical protein
MKKHIQLSLTVAALLYLVWAISFLIMPETAHSYFSTADKIDEGMLALFAASLLAFAVIFMLAINNPSNDMVQVSAVGLGTIAVVAAYQMFISDGISLNVSTVLSLIVTAGLATYLIIVSTDGLADMFTGTGGGAKRKAPRKKAKKKVKKKAKKKTKKKAVKRRAR